MACREISIEVVSGIDTGIKLPDFTTRIVVCWDQDGGDLCGVDATGDAIAYRGNLGTRVPLTVAMLMLGGIGISLNEATKRYLDGLVDDVLAYERDEREREAS